MIRARTDIISLLNIHLSTLFIDYSTYINPFITRAKTALDLHLSSFNKNLGDQDFQHGSIAMVLVKIFGIYTFPTTYQNLRTIG